MALGFSGLTSIVSGAKMLSDIMSDNKKQSGNITGAEKFVRSQAIRQTFEQLKRPTKSLQKQEKKRQVLQ